MKTFFIYGLLVSVFLCFFAVFKSVTEVFFAKAKSGLCRLNKGFGLVLTLALRSVNPL